MTLDIHHPRRQLQGLLLVWHLAQLHIHTLTAKAMTSLPGPQAHWNINVVETPPSRPEHLQSPAVPWCWPCLRAAAGRTAPSSSAFLSSAEPTAHPSAPLLRHNWPLTSSDSANQHLSKQNSCHYPWNTNQTVPRRQFSVTADTEW